MLCYYCVICCVVFCIIFIDVIFFVFFVCVFMVCVLCVYFCLNVFVYRCFEECVWNVFYCCVLLMCDVWMIWMGVCVLYLLMLVFLVLKVCWKCWCVLVCEEFYLICFGILCFFVSVRGWRSRRGGFEEGFDGSLWSVDFVWCICIVKMFLCVWGVGFGVCDWSYGVFGVYFDDVRGEDVGFFERARGELFEFVFGYVLWDDVVVVCFSCIEWNVIDELVVYDLVNVWKDVYGFVCDGVDVSARGRVEFFV